MKPSYASGVFGVLHDVSEYDSVSSRFSEIGMNPELLMHSNGVGFWATGMSIRLYRKREKREIVAISGLLHDYGKLKIPDEILGKHGPITDEEFKFVKQHPRITFNSIGDLPYPECRLVMVGHHEFQKNPYPRTKIREDSNPEILSFTQILGVADQLTAMVCSRSYKMSYGKSQALAEIENNFRGDGKYIQLLSDIMF